LLSKCNLYRYAAVPGKLVPDKPARVFLNTAMSGIIQGGGLSASPIQLDRCSCLKAPGDPTLGMYA
jgi:hypothetical protein